MERQISQFQDKLSSRRKSKMTASSKNLITNV